MIKRQMLCDLAQPVIAFLRFVVCVNIAERPHERFRYHVFRIFGMIQVPPRYAEQMAGGNFEKLFAFRQVAVFDLFKSLFTSLPITDIISLDTRSKLLCMTTCLYLKSISNFCAHVNLFYPKEKRLFLRRFFANRNQSSAERMSASSSAAATERSVSSAVGTNEGNSGDSA